MLLFKGMNVVSLKYKFLRDFTCGPCQPHWLQRRHRAGKLHTSLLVQVLGVAGDLPIEGGLSTPNVYDLAGHDAPAPWARRLQGALSKSASRPRFHVFMRALDALPRAGRSPGGESPIKGGGDTTPFELFNDWEGRGCDNSVPEEVTKTISSGVRTA